MMISPNLCLPDEIRDRFAAVSEIIGKTHRSLGLIVDEYVSELPHGLHMQAYELFADLYRQITGESISPVTIRHWRRSVTQYSKADMGRFESLTDSQLTEAVKLAEINKIEPIQVAEWAVANAVDSVPAMRAHWLPQTTYNQEIDLPVVSGLIRYADKHLPRERRARFDELVIEIRGLFTPEQGE